MKLFTHAEKDPDAREPVKRREIKNPVAVGAALMAVATVAGIMVNIATFSHANAQAAATPEVTALVTPTPTPPPTPTPTPTVNSIKLYAYGRELDDGGFTTYVGDKPIELSVVLDPALARPRVSWSVNDKESASLIVSSDGLSCTYTPLKPSGKNELTIRCYGAEVVFPVYLWER